MNAMKTNHMTNKIKSLAAATMALALFALGFAGCQQTADGGSMAQALDGSKKQAYITLSLGGQGGLVSKTTLPSAADAVWKSFELVGTATTAGDLTNISYNTPAQCDDPVADLQAAQIPAREGAVYNLTLTAVTTGGAVYSAKATSSSIGEGDNPVAFDLKISALGSAGAQDGSAQIALNLPANVTRLTVSVYKVSASGTPESSPVSPELTEKALDIAAQKAAFDSGVLEPGPYLAKFTLWGGAQGDSVIGNWEEYFGIAGGMTSRGTLGKIDGSADDDRADEAYSITYHRNASAEVPATVTARTSYSRHTVVDQEYVKSLSSRAGYRMMGWYTDEQLTQAFVSTSGMEAPLDLYAKWSEEIAIYIPDFERGSMTAKPAGGTVGDPAIADETVTLSLTPDSGWTFGGITLTACDAEGNDLDPQPTDWPLTIERGLATETSKTFTMPSLPYGSKVKVEPTMLELFAVNVAATTNGTVAVETQYNTKIGSTPAAATGDTVTLTITPANYYEKDSYTVDGNPINVDSNKQYKFQMGTSAASVSATFKKIKYTLALSASPSAKGSVKAVYKGTSTEISNGTLVEWGKEITITATASDAKKYRLKALSATGVSIGTTSPQTFTMPTKAVSVTATFEDACESGDYTPDGTETIDGKTFDCVKFGLWPQTIKKSNVSITSTTKTVGMFTCNKGSDNEWYVKVDDSKNYPNGKYSDGSAADGGTKYFKMEPIKWRVLTKNYNSSGKALLLAQSCLMSDISYSGLDWGVERTIGGKTVYQSNYQHSRLRAFLNGITYIGKDNANVNDFKGKGFFQTAFNSDEQEIIVETTVKNDKDSATPTGVTPYWDCSTVCCADTKDKIFVLSAKEMFDSNYGFGGSTPCQWRKAVDYACALENHGEIQWYTDNYCNSWILRSPFVEGASYQAESSMYSVNCSSGEVGTLTSVQTNNLDALAIVPALCVDLSKLSGN